MTSSAPGTGRRSPWWALPASLAALVAAAAVVAIATGAGSRHWQQSTSTSTRGYQIAGTDDGVTFWLRTQEHSIAALTTGRLGTICNGVIDVLPAAAYNLSMCNDSAPAGGVAAVLVPATTRQASIAGTSLQVLARTSADPPGFTLAVLIVAPGVDLPQGPVTTRS